MNDSGQNNFIPVPKERPALMNDATNTAATATATGADLPYATMAGVITAIEDVQQLRRKYCSTSAAHYSFWTNVLAGLLANKATLVDRLLEASKG